MPLDIITYSKVKKVETSVNNIKDGTTVIPTYELKANKNVANGYVGLDNNVKIPLIYLYDVVLGQLEYAGSFNPNNGYPTQTNALDPNRDIRKGDYFIANANGTISGVEYNTGDWAVRGASDWQKIDNTDAVVSVNGKIGVVELDAEDVGALPDDTLIPAKLSDLVNDSGFITENDIPAIPTIPDITINNGNVESGKYISQVAVDETDKHKLVITKADLPQGFSGNYDDLIGAPTIPTVPTISTSITTDATDDTKTASPKAVKTYVDNAISTAIGDLLGGES